jgi:hypothetical protein
MPGMGTSASWSVRAFGWGVTSGTTFPAPRYGYVFSKTGTANFPIPASVTTVNVETIGAGGLSAAAGGAGGAYSKSVVTVTPSSTFYVNVPTSTGDAWGNTSNAAPTLSSTGALAKGGTSAVTNTPGVGGSAASSVGTITYSGGSGASAAGLLLGKGGGGGAAGPGGPGRDGGAGSSTAGGGGGGADGLLSTAGAAAAANFGIGGYGPLGTGAGLSSQANATFGLGGGGAGSNAAILNGGSGANYFLFGGLLGPGGGGGGAGAASSGGYGSVPGFGGGSGGADASSATSQGLVSVTWTPPAAVTTYAASYAFIVAGTTSDASGNIYTVGFYGGSAGIYVQKVDSSQQIKWQKLLISAPAAYVGNICVDNSGNVYICFVDDGSGLSYIVKYNSSGVLQWQRKFTTGGLTLAAPRIALNAAQTMVWVLTGGPAYSCYLTKYDTSGTYQLQRTVGMNGATTEYSMALAIDTADNIFIAITSFTVTGSCCCITTHYADVIKINSSLAVSVSYAYNSTDPIYISVTTDSSNNFYVVSDISPGTTIQKFNSSNASQWVKKNGVALPQGAVVDSSGNVYVVQGGFSGITARYFKLNSSGAVQFQKSLVYSGMVGVNGPINGATISLSGSSVYQPTQYSVLVLPTAGPTNGTYGPIVIATTTDTFANGTALSTSSLMIYTPGAPTTSNSSFTDGTFSSIGWINPLG